MAKKHLRKVKKVFAAASVIALFGGVTAFADTYINKLFDENNVSYGKYMLDVNCVSNMRSCEAKAWGSNSYKYKVILTTTYSNGQELVQDTGYQPGQASIQHSYEWAEDYQAMMIVQEGIENKYRVRVSGS